MIRRIRESTSIFDESIERYVARGLESIINQDMKMEEMPETAQIEEIKDGMRYICFPYGKLLRARLAFGVGRGYGVPIKILSPHIAVLEAVHAGTLAIDDEPTQDNATMRRDKLSCWIYYLDAYKQRIFDAGDLETREKLTRGEYDDEALNYGVNITRFSFDQLRENVFSYIRNGPATNGQREKIQDELARTYSALIPGQITDLHHTQKLETLEDFLNFYKQKTGSLFGASAAVGAILAGKRNGTVSQWRRFGINLGVAFQIADDVLEYLGASEGKSAEDYSGKKTIFDVSDMHTILEERKNIIGPSEINLIEQLPDFGFHLVYELYSGMERQFKEKAGKLLKERFNYSLC